LRAFLAVGAALGVCLALAGAAAAQEAPQVLAVEFENDVNPVTANFVMDQIDRANDEGLPRRWTTSSRRSLHRRSR
jgi:membrane-bound ClpP family serine protease